MTFPSHLVDRSYIGDGIYVQVDEQDHTRLILTTNSHKLEDADAVIYLEVIELRALKKFIDRFLEQGA